MPPRVNDGLMMIGNPISPAMEKASSMLRANPLAGTRRPMFSMARLNFSRSSALWMTSGVAPIISTPNRSSTPISWTFTDTFRPVWPPRVGSTASGRSISMIRATTSGVMGSM